MSFSLDRLLCAVCNLVSSCRNLHLSCKHVFNFESSSYNVFKCWLIIPILATYVSISSMHKVRDTIVSMYICHQVTANKKLTSSIDLVCSVSCVSSLEMRPWSLARSSSLSCCCPSKRSCKAVNEYKLLNIVVNFFDPSFVPFLLCEGLAINNAVHNFQNFKSNSTNKQCHINNLLFSCSSLALAAVSLSSRDELCLVSTFACKSPSSRALSDNWLTTAWRFLQKYLVLIKH